VNERIVRDLLDANIKLTDQIVELARLAIGAPAGLVPQDTYDHTVEYAAEQAHKMPVVSTADDWDDIPDVPMGTQPPEPTRFHMNEDEEVAHFQAQLGLISTQQLEEVVKKAGLPNNVIEFEKP
jgi:hypothetical protein